MLQQLIISMPLFVCAIISWELMVLLRERWNNARFFLLVWSLTATVLYAAHYVYFQHATQLLPLTDTLYVASNLTVYPLYLIHIYELTDTRQRVHRWRWMCIVLALGVLMGLAVGVVYRLMSPAEMKQFVCGYLYRESNCVCTGWATVQVVLHECCRGLFGVGVIVTLWLGIKKIRAFNALVDMLYADTEDKYMCRLGHLLVLLLVTAVASLVVSVLGRYHFVSSSWLAVPSVLFSVLLLLIGHEGIHDRFTICDIEADEEPHSSEKDATQVAQHQQSVMPFTVQDEASGTTHNDEKTEDIARRLRDLVEEQKMFRQPNLKLDDVARQIGTNRTYLLRAMRVVMQMTFSEYINHQRAAYAHELMLRHPEMSKAEVAQQSGFGSVSAFYRNLRDHARKADAAPDTNK